MTDDETAAYNRRTAGAWWSMVGKGARDAAAEKIDRRQLFGL